MGRYRAAQGRTEEARADLERLCRDRPDDLFAAGALLYCLHEQADWAAMGRALGPLPPPVKGEPWVLTLMRGRYANHMKRFAEAVACFELLLADDPASASAYAGLAAADAGLGKTEERLEALRRGRVLSLIQGQLGAAQQAPGDPKPLARLAELCGEIGLEPHSRLMRGLAERAAGRDAGSRGDSDAAATRRDPAPERGEEVTNVPQGTKAENDAP
jgi:tetratricopeptide (TPR) repeat protein